MLISDKVREEARKKPRGIIAKTVREEICAIRRYKKRMMQIRKISIYLVVLLLVVLLFIILKITQL